MMGLEYERYLREVVMALEEDESFRKKLEETNMTDIKVIVDKGLAVLILDNSLAVLILDEGLAVLILDNSLAVLT